MITTELFERLFPTAGLTSAKNLRRFNLVREREKLIAALNKFLPKYKINNFHRLCAFLSCCGVETDYFRTTVEYASGEAYERRRDLGNTQPGDGRRFKGRSLIQTTGRDNYERVQKRIGKRLGIDVIKNPQLLAEVEIAVEAACIFWEENRLNYYADRGLIKELNGIVNRGDKDLPPLHWAKRNELYSLCKRRVPEDFSFAEKTAPSSYQSRTLAVDADNQPVGLTGTDSADKSSFLASAFDKNVSGEQVKTALPSFGKRVWRYIARPLALLYAALEAGNVAAWLGIVVALAIVVYLIYAHRKDFLKIWETLKNKFLS